MDIKKYIKDLGDIDPELAKRDWDELAAAFKLARRRKKHSWFWFCREGAEACPLDTHGRVNWDQVVGRPVFARVPGEGQPGAAGGFQGVRHLDSLLTIAAVAGAEHGQSGTAGLESFGKRSRVLEAAFVQRFQTTSLKRILGEGRPRRVGRE